MRRVSKHCNIQHVDLNLNGLLFDPNGLQGFLAIDPQSRKQSEMNWTSNVSLFPFFPSSANNQATVKAKEELFDAIAPLDRCANASPQVKLLSISVEVEMSQST